MHRLARAPWFVTYTTVDYMVGVHLFLVCRLDIDFSSSSVKSEEEVVASPSALLVTVADIVCCLCFFIAALSFLRRCHSVG